MKIATYNVRNLYDPGTFIDETKQDAVNEDFFNKRIDYFTNIFKEKDLDIICLQEIGGEKGIRIIAENLDYEYFSAKPNKRGIRMAMLYKKSLKDNIVCESVSLGDLVIPGMQEKGDTDGLKPISQRRDVLVIDTTYCGKKLRVITFHLKSLLPTYLLGDDVENDKRAHTDAKFRSIFYKMMELRGLREYTNKSLEEGREVILAGDFNEDNNSSIIDILKSANKDKDNERLYDVLVGYNKDKRTHMYRGNPLTFDTMVVSSQIKENIDSVTVFNEDLKDYSGLAWGEVEHVIESDHAMVVMEIKG